MAIIWNQRRWLELGVGPIDELSGLGCARRSSRLGDLHKMVKGTLRIGLALIKILSFL